MKLLTLISIACFFPLNLFANISTKPNQYRIESKVYINDVLVSQPKITTLANESAMIGQEDDKRIVTLTHTIIENKDDLSDSDVLVTSKLDVVEGASQKITQSTVALTFGESKQSVFSYLKSIVNDGPEVETTFKVTTKVIKL